jgi:hypothetical protein
MKKLSAGLAGVLLFVVAAPAWAVDVTGELVDLACYTKDQAKNVGAEHRDCAMTCAKMGMTVALVTANGEVYRVAGELAKDRNARLVRHMGHKVAVQGSLGIAADGAKTIEGTTIKMVSQ